MLKPRHREKGEGGKNKNKKCKGFYVQCGGDQMEWQESLVVEGALELGGRRGDLLADLGY